MKAFCNFIKINFDSTLQNPCDTPMFRKLYRPGKPNHWSIVEKETIDEIIFRTNKARNRLMLELMARGGMRVGEVLKLTRKMLSIRSLSYRLQKAEKMLKSCSSRGGSLIGYTSISGTKASSPATEYSRSPTGSKVSRKESR
jgi:integrase